MGALATGRLPAAQIARKMGLARQSVQRIVDILAEEQVVEFAENPYHQRAKLLMAQLGKGYARSPALSLAQSVVAQMRRITGEHPTIDFALVALANALHLPSGTALAIFALGRTIGWIGHAIEQYQTDRLIRPRARYVGKMPTEV